MRGKRLSLYWYLVGVSLLSIAVAGLVFFLSERTLTPLVTRNKLERTLTSIEQSTGEQFSPSQSQMVREDLLIASQAATRRTLLLGLGIAGLAAAGVSVVLARRIALPLKKIKDVSRDIAAERYDQQVAVDAPAEISELAAAINVMAEKLKATEQRRTELLSNVTHELGTPLSSLQGYVEGLEDGIVQADTKTLSVFKRQLKRLDSLVEDLATLSRAAEGVEVKFETLRVNTLLRRTEEAFKLQFGSKGVDLEVLQDAADVEVLADPELTAQIVNNLIVNALRHTPPGGKVQLRSYTTQQSVRFEVLDSGEGITSDALPYVFTRFFRADSARARGNDRGNGIGLTIAKHYAQAQGGQIGVESQLGQGSSFWFTLPSAQETS